MCPHQSISDYMDHSWLLSLLTWNFPYQQWGNNSIHAFRYVSQCTVQCFQSHPTNKSRAQVAFAIRGSQVSPVSPTFVRLSCSPVTSRLLSGVSCPILAPRSSYWKMVLNQGLRSRSAHSYQESLLSGHRSSESPPAHIPLGVLWYCVFNLCAQEWTKVHCFLLEKSKSFNKGFKPLACPCILYVVLLCRPMVSPLQLSYFPSPWKPLTHSVSTILPSFWMPQTNNLCQMSSFP